MLFGQRFYVLHSFGGTISSIYLYPVPTLLLHDRKETNVCFMAVEYPNMLQNLGSDQVNLNALCHTFHNVYTVIF